MCTEAFPFVIGKSDMFYENSAVLVI